jgi:hypothetical protein
MADAGTKPQSGVSDKAGYLIPVERIDRAILEIRGRKVMLSYDLAALYGVSTKVFNQAVKRNAGRFPPDFMFQLSWEEAQVLRSQFVTLDEASPRSQFATLKRGKHYKYRPYAFSEHGAVMAATILNTPRAVEVSVFVVRAFVRLSRAAADQRRLALKLAELESKLASHDKNFQVVFDALRRLMQPPEPKKKRIGFITADDRPGAGSDFLARDRPCRRRRASPRTHPQTPHTPQP